MMSLLRKVSGLIRNRLGPHAQRAFTLVSGASAAQLVPLAIAPILTRLYSPSDFGVLAIFASVTAILTAVAAGRYTVAIMLPDRDRDAVQVTGLALLIAAAVSLLLLALAPVALAFFGRLGIIHDLGGWLYLVPAAVFMGSMSESLSYFSLRRDKVGVISRAKVLRTTTSGGAQILLGVLGAGVLGLLGGSLIGLATGNLRLIQIFLDAVRTSPVRWCQVKEVAAKYSNFPKFDLWGSLANTLGYNVITIGIGLIYAYQSLGQYALAFRTASLPSALIGVAIGQVYLREAARRVDSPVLALRAFYKTTLILAAVSVPPMAVIGIWGQQIFGLVFGAEWQLAGVYASAMMPLVWARFVASPMTSAFYVYGRQRVFLISQVVLLVITLATMTVASQVGWSLETLLFVQSSVLGFFYLILLYLARRTIINTLPPDARPQPYSE